MDLSLFDVVGPVMIGPSSSHTAGAARLARAATMIVGKPFTKVSFGLHGSLAKTGAGHGTDKALLAGVLGLREDDEKIKNSFVLAKSMGIAYTFYDLEMESCHENSVRITFTCKGGSTQIIEGSSIGGGRILISRINGIEAKITAEAPTLLITQKDIKGMVSEISHILSEENLNIGIMRVNRASKGGTATTIIETDSPIPLSVSRRLCAVRGILSVQIIELK